MGPKKIIFLFLGLKAAPKKNNKKNTPTVGIEPTTIGLKGQRSTFWAKWANKIYYYFFIFLFFLGAIFYFIIFYFIRSLGRVV